MTQSTVQSSPIPSSNLVSTVDASPSGYRRLTADLNQLEASLPPVTLTRRERETMRSHGRYSPEAMYACVELATDPLCVERRVALSRADVDAKLAHAIEAKRLARALRRLAQHVTDDALIVSSELATEAMQVLDLVDALASRPGGDHLRSRVDEARALVRGERRSRKQKKQDAPTPPKA